MYCLQSYEKKEEQPLCEQEYCKNECPYCLIENKLHYEIMRKVVSFRTDNGLLDFSAVLSVIGFYKLSDGLSLDVLSWIEFQDRIILEIREKNRKNQESTDRAKSRGTQK